MRFTRICALAFGLLACGGARVRPEPASDSEQVEHSVVEPSVVEEDSSGDSASVAEPACPATFAEARGGCVAGPATGDCDYPEGECYCGEAPVCSGAAREPMPPEAYSWQCTPVPPEVRADGCPGNAPNEGAACSLDHSCGYGSCSGSTYDCVEGEWHMTGFTGPPP